MIGATITARMGSSRLPGKVLAGICGKPLLSHIAVRLRRSRVEKIILATTPRADDNILADWARKEGIPCFRGSEDDVLDRVVHAHRIIGSEIVVQAWGDSPFIDPWITDQAIMSVESGVDIALGEESRLWPRGTCPHVCRMKSLEWVHGNVVEPEARANITWYLYQHPEMFHVHRLSAPKSWRCGGAWLTVDWQEDLELARLIQDRLGPYEFGTAEIASLLRRETWLTGINGHLRETE